MGCLSLGTWGVGVMHGVQGRMGARTAPICPLNLMMMMIFAYNLSMGCFPILCYIELSGCIFVMGG